MSESKTNAEVLEEQTNEAGVNEIKFVDKLILLDSGSLLMARVLTDTNLESNFLCLYKPVEILGDIKFGEVAVRDWIGESDDEFFYLPVSKVTNISNPSPFYRKAFTSFITPVSESYGQVIH